MASPNIPENFLNWLANNTKKVSIVVKIDGVEDIFTSVPVGTRIRYGDGTLYGETVGGEPLVYGGLRPYTTPGGGVARSLLSIDKSTLNRLQKLEQEQGKASVSQMSLAFLDKDGYFTRLCTPGLVVPEIMGRDVQVYLGSPDISFPEDYWLIFRGRVQTIDTIENLITLKLADPNLRRRRAIFYTATTQLTSSISQFDTTFSVVNNSDFYEQIAGPSGIPDTTVRTYLKIDEEWIEYPYGSLISNAFLLVTRGARGTTAVAHAAGADVTAAIEIEGNPLEMALKIMLSGWDGPYKTAVPIQHIVFTGDPDLGNVANSITLEPGTNAVVDLGLTPGDYITITGDGVPANNTTVIVDSFMDLPGQENAIIVTNTNLSVSVNSTGVMALRSQYDTWPVEAGVKMYPWEVDIASHQDLIEGYLAAEQMRDFIQAPVNFAKDYIEKELYLPVSAYSLTREGRCAVKVTLPPIADQTLQIVDNTVVVRPNELSIQRSLSNRNFWNEVDYTYDLADDGDYKARLRFLDATSLSQIEVLQVLPIVSRGTKSDLTSVSLIQSRANRILTRYRRAAILLKGRVNFQVGAIMEPGDIVVIRDDGTLHIPNFDYGTRDLGSQLFEVKEVSLDIVQGNVAVTFLGGLGFNIIDRFATIAPSSQCSATGSNTTQVRIVPSYGQFFGANEWKKWEDYVGTNIAVHTYDYTTYEEVTLVSLDAGNPNILNVSPALSFTPNATHIVDLANYPTSTDPFDQEIQKIIHCFSGRTVPIVSGISNTQFTVNAGDIDFFIVGRYIEVRTANWSTISPEVLITDVTGTTVTVENMGFTPNNTYKAELVAWYDGRGPYRIL